MLPTLPLELIGEILKYAYESACEVQDQPFDPRAVDASIRKLLLAASLVSSTWRPLAQDFLLRRVSVTFENYQELVGRIKGRGEGFAESIRFLRVIGDDPSQLWTGDSAVLREVVPKNTVTLDQAMAMLPRVEMVELVQVLALEGSWLTGSPHLRHIHLIDSGFVRNPREPKQLSLDSLHLSSFSSEADRTREMWMTMMSCHSTLKIGALRYGNLGVGLQQFIAVGSSATIACISLDSLFIDSFVDSTYITGAKPSPWTHFPSLQALSAPFTILFDGDPAAPPCLSPAHPLPPTLHTLTLRPSNRPQAALSSSNYAEPQIAGHSLTDTTAILLATIKKLPDLRELSVEAALHGDELMRECEARGMSLRCCSVGD